MPGEEPVGASLTKTGYRAVNYFLIQLLKRVIINAEPLRNAGAVLLNNDVSILYQTVEYFLCLGILQIQANAFFVPVDLKVRHTQPVHERQGVAPEVAALCGLYAYDLRAEIRKRHRAHRAGVHGAQVENFYSGKRHLHEVRSPFHVN